MSKLYNYKLISINPDIKPVIYSSSTEINSSEIARIWEEQTGICGHGLTSITNVLDGSVIEYRPLLMCADIQIVKSGEYCILCADYHINRCENRWRTLSPMPCMFCLKITNLHPELECSVKATMTEQQLEKHNRI